MEAPKKPDVAKARRPRAARACELCRLKKNKCDELVPCTYCRNRNVECIYRNSDNSRRTVYSTEYVKQLERQVKILSSREAKPELSRDDLLLTLQIGSPPANTPSQELAGAEGSFNDIGPPGAASTASPSTGNPSTEVSGVNRHTKNVEFYGRSSSMALLSRVQRNEGASPLEEEEEEDDDDDNEASLVTQLHNPGFFPLLSEGSNSNRLKTPAVYDVSYIQQCRAYLNGFFSTIHFIHPILDKNHFLARCEDHWAGNSASLSRSFVALYYSLLSLGALVGAPEEDSIDGMSNHDWSRKFFNEARALCGELNMTTDLEMVQCFFFMAKICQNELNPHLAYMFIGQAVRTALAMGINREPPAGSRKSIPLLKEESRTWWGLYSLETEMSFAMGRPDTLGVDLYHNRRYPLIGGDSVGTQDDLDMLEPAHCAIIQIMVDFSRITRTVCLGLYLSESPMNRNLTLARQIEVDLDHWLDELPPSIRPTRTFLSSRSLKYVKDAQYMKKQRLVLSIRYHNVRMLLFASFLTRERTSIDQVTPEMVPEIYKENIQKCLGSAKETIEIIYETYRHHDFFRTWYYNTTYTLFAVSIVLVYIVQEASDEEKQSLYPFVEMSIEVLETMDDCVVAVKAAKMIRRALKRAREGADARAHQQAREVVDMGNSGALNHYWGALNFMDGQIDVGFPFEIGDLDDSHMFSAFGAPEG